MQLQSHFIYSRAPLQASAPMVAMRDNLHGLSLSPDGDRLYLTDIGGDLRCLEPGLDPLWKVNRYAEAKGCVSNTPVELRDGALVFYEGFNQKSLTCLGPDRTPRWSHPVASEDSLRPPVHLEGRIVTLRRKGDDRFLVGLRPEDGSEAWTTRLESHPKEGPLATPDGRVLVTTCEGTLRCFGGDGAELWTRPHPNGMGFGFIGLSSRGLATVDRELNSLAAYRQSDGEPVWTHRAGPREQLKFPPVEGPDGTLYLPLWSASSLRALDPDTGRTLWELPLPEDLSEGRPTVGQDGRIRLPLGRTLWVINPDGSVDSRRQFSHHLHGRCAVTEAGTALVGAHRKVYRVSARRTAGSMSLRRATAETAAARLGVEADWLERSDLSQESLVDLAMGARFAGELSRAAEVPERTVQGFLVSLATDPDVPTEERAATLAFLRSLDRDASHALVQALATTDNLAAQGESLRRVAAVLRQQPPEGLTTALDALAVARSLHTPASVGMGLTEQFLTVGTVRVRRRTRG
ncbi:MAG: PQQ-binding-like beta-propeller repeat protein [Candidatus Eremiobacterota bacterium]